MIVLVHAMGENFGSDLEKLTDDLNKYPTSTTYVDFNFLWIIVSRSTVVR